MQNSDMLGSIVPGIQTEAKAGASPRWKTQWGLQLLMWLSASHSGTAKAANNLGQKPASEAQTAQPDVVLPFARGKTASH